MFDVRPVASVRPFLVLVLVAALAAGCGGGEGPTVQKTGGSVVGRVALGALGGARVAVYRAGQYGTPVATATTSDGATPSEIGRFSFALPETPADAMFLLVASGGQARDADGDGVLDDPTPNLGEVHAVASAAQLTGGEVVLSAVTEVVYRRVRYFLQALYDDAYLARAADAWASFVLRSSVAGGPAIDAVDALAYDPAVHAAATFRPHGEFADFGESLLLGTAAAADAFHLSEQEVNSQALPDTTYGVDVVGDLAFLCNGFHGLGIWDVSDPTHFRSVGLYDTPGQAYRVQVVGSLAYVADLEGGLAIVDVSDPRAPALVGSLGVEGVVTDVHVVGNRAYLSNGDFGAPGLLVVDVSAPATPVVLGEVATEGVPGTVRAHGDHVYALASGWIEVVDASDPLAPVSVGTVPTDLFSQMDLASGHLFVASYERFQALSLAVPSSPQPVASLPLPGYGASSLRVLGSQAFVGRTFGLSVVDVSDPSQPVHRGHIPTVSSVIDVDREGSLLVLTEVNGGFAAVAAGTPPPSAVVATVPLAEIADSVEAARNRVYVTTTFPSALTVFDAADPLAPAVLGSVPLGSHTGEAVALDGTVALVAEFGAFHAYDVSNPAAPTSLGANDSRGELKALALGPDVAYVVTGGVLAVHDVSDPATLEVLATFPVTGDGRGVAYGAGTLAVASGGSGLEVWDATTPAAPLAVGHLDLWQTLDVALQPPFAFVTQMPGETNRGHLAVADLSVRNAPTLSADVTLPGPADQVSRSGGYAYVGGWSTGVHVVDVSAPAGASFAGTIPVPANVADLDADGEWVYVVSGYPSGGLHVLRAARVEVP